MYLFFKYSQEKYCSCGLSMQENGIHKCLHSWDQHYLRSNGNNGVPVLSKNNTLLNEILETNLLVVYKVYPANLY